MQYKIFCDDYILYDSELNKFQLENPVLLNPKLSI